MAEIKKRYSDEELEEFKQIINEKLERANQDYQDMMRALRNDEGNDVADTSPTYKILEEGAITQNKQELHRLFFDLRDRMGQTFVIVTHDEQLADLADRKICMRDGLIETQ